ncbi:MAG: hypothetical protein GY929_04440 [Actinomycetia bacterium]|nr:hypothetical protein [Actinomycetes bacterium]
MTARERFRRTEGPLVTEGRHHGGRGMSWLLAAALPVVALVGFWAQVAGDDQDAAAAEASGPSVVADDDDTMVPSELRTVVFVGATGIVVGGAAWLAFRMLGTHRQRLEDVEGH